MPFFIVMDRESNTIQRRRRRPRKALRDRIAADKVWVIRVNDEKTRAVLLGADGEPDGRIDIVALKEALGEDFTSVDHRHVASEFKPTAPDDTPETS